MGRQGGGGGEWLVVRAGLARGHGVSLFAFGGAGVGGRGGWHKASVLGRRAASSSKVSPPHHIRLSPQLFFSVPQALYCHGQSALLCPIRQGPPSGRGPVATSPAHMRQCGIAGAPLGLPSPLVRLCFDRVELKPLHQPHRLHWHGPPSQPQCPPLSLSPSQPLWPYPPTPKSPQPLCPPPPGMHWKGRPPQKRLGRRLEEVAKAVGGGYCRLPMALRLALGVRGTVAGHRLGALEGRGVPAPAATSTSSICQLLGAADAQTAHHATFSTAPTHQLLGSVNAETTLARAPAAADRKQQPDATCEGKNG